MISFQQKKVTPFHKYCLPAIGTVFSTKFVLDDAKLQNIVVLMYQIQVFITTHLLEISVLRTNKSFKILKSKKTQKSQRCLGRVTNENMIAQAILDRILQTNSLNYVKQVFISNVSHFRIFLHYHRSSPYIPKISEISFRNLKIS